MSEKIRFYLLAAVLSAIALFAVVSLIAGRINLTTFGLTAVILGVPLVRLLRYLIKEHKNDN